MHEIISKRKSIRKYDLTPLDEAVLVRIEEKTKQLRPLYPHLAYDIKIVNSTRGIFNTKAPHYLILSSEVADGCYENIGFLGQQMDLYFSENGLGACWLGSAKPAEAEVSSLPHVIAIAFGNPAEPLHRDISQFKRKPLEEISEGSDERLEAARLAPSALNAQNWFFVAAEGKIHCYRKLANPLLGFIYNRLHAIDMGIAIYHLALESEEFHFGKETDAPVRAGYVYTGTVSG